MVAVVDDADTAVDVVADGAGIGGRGAADALVVTIHSGVVVTEQVGSKVIDVYVVVFVVVAGTTSGGGDALADGEPCCRGVQVSFVVNNLVDMVGHLGCGLAAKTTNDKFVVRVVTGSLSIRQVTLARIARVTGAGRDSGTRDLSHVTDEKDVGQCRMLVVKR